jgi:serine/threonine protein kinase
MCFERKRERIGNTRRSVDLCSCMQEANLWRKLQSRDIVRLMGVGAQQHSSLDDIKESFYVVCEYMDGGTLRSKIEKQMVSSRKDVYSCMDVFRCVGQIASR